MNETHSKYHSPMHRKGIYNNSVKLLLALSILKDANHYLFYVLLKHMYIHVTTEHFILKLISFPANLACHLTLSNTTIICNDSLDSFWHSRMHDF